MLIFTVLLFGASMVFSVDADCNGGFGCALLNLTAGTVRGNEWEYGREFLTIPYAKANRFEPPQVRKVLPGEPGSVFDATNILGFGQDACLQGPYTNDQESYGVEDCLILNLYLPTAQSVEANTNAQKMPILIWIFGGDNTASEIIPYNATVLAGRHNAAVAVVSYRLGVLGFAAFEEDVKYGSTGNNGMLDILAAAKWLKREAANFGADPNRIIVFGESSGATDSQLLTMIPEASGLIQGSIAESGGLYAQELEEAIKNTKKVGASVGCHDVFGKKEFKTCMIGKNASDMMSEAGNFDWGPTVDRVFLPAQPLQLASEGRFNINVSLIWGANTNDSAMPFLLDLYIGEKEYVKLLNGTIHGKSPFSPPLTTSADLGGRENKEIDIGLGVGDNNIVTRSRTAWKRRHHHQRVFESHRRHRNHQDNEDEEYVSSQQKSGGEDLLARALKLYPPNHPAKGNPLGNNAILIGWFMSDQFLCNTRREVSLASRSVDAFMYRFDWLFQSHASCIADSNYHDPRSGSNHCDEMTFVFGQPIFDNQDPPGYSYTNCSDPQSKYYDAKRCVGCFFDEREGKFSNTVGNFWTAFAQNGVPSSTSGGVEWLPFTTKDGVVPVKEGNIYLHPDGIRMEPNMGRSEACAFWDDVRKSGH